MTDYCSVCL